MQEDGGVSDTIGDDSPIGRDCWGLQFRSMALDLLIMAVLGSGNDYLPPMQHVTLAGTLHSSLWKSYLAMRASSVWKTEYVSLQLDSPFAAVEALWKAVYVAASNKSPLQQ
jgi:hypothetical protein